ncbi:unnamed protein product [Darwinula stevensoni]|uniref:Uracil-DNA glycosylase n=1 Tax=Darwinula stevensoni TaxID=69355 RepID=A0A7R9AHM8_9CRUS|nr:unnamed protein product [Darwinula stevensoni]CAG0904935.1 unnamed protein product [Darwinula stevensoni]
MGVGIGADRVIESSWWNGLKPRIIDEPVGYFIQFGIEAKLKALNVLEIMRTAKFPVAQTIAKDKLDISGANFAHQGLLDISSSALENLAKSVHSNAEITAKINELLQAKEPHLVSKLMEVIFGTAIGTKSSDVHIEAAEDHGRLRYRQDGVLQDIIDFPLEIYKQLNSRIKLLSEMKISSSAIAQDGRFTINYKEIEIEIRTSLIPGPYGESIVMRILNPEGLTVDMEKLGFDKNLFEILGHEIRKPNGMILNTGPTGSGKTTTLYSILKTIYSPEIKLLTIEDPIEYHLDGITQTQIDHEKGYGFAEGLRAALRQDPDVVMVGEIRDKETATTAVNASLTGHLVLSTLHTNNAAGAIPRMIELGVSPRILPDALTLCMAQRLVRKLCTSCRRKATITETQEKLLRDILTDAQKNKKPLHLYNITPESDLELYTAGPGCPRCNNTGFKGQTGLFEAIRIDDAVIDAINKNPSERDIRRAAASQGIFTMAEDAVRVVILGQDPYHGAGQANGLSFAVQSGMKIPPSLQNIFKEIRSDLGIEPLADGDLSRWARQGVLLLNSTLTVCAGRPASHAGLGWEEFTDEVITKLSDEREHIVFILWGNYARAKGAHIDRTKHLVIESVHPSPFSAHSGFFGSQPFSQANTYLREHGLGEIDWR